MVSGSICNFGCWIICCLHNQMVSNACYYLFLVVDGCCCLSLLVVNSRQKQELQQGVNLELLSQFPTHFKQSCRNVNNQLVTFRYPITDFSFWIKSASSESSLFFMHSRQRVNFKVVSIIYFWIIPLLSQFEINYRPSNTLASLTP